MVSKNDPNMIGLQQQIKNNNVDLTAMVNDLSDWSTEITAKEKTLKTTKGKTGGAASAGGQAVRGSK